MAYIGRGLESGAFRQLDDISSSFNGSTTAFTMQVNSANVSVGDVNQIILSLGGVIQKPDTDFTISSSTLTFTTAPVANTSFFAILLGSDNGGTVTPSDASVTSGKLASTILTGATDIGGAIADADLFLIDDGAGGTLRKTAASRLKTYIGGSDPASADGDSLGTASLEWSDLYLADGGIIYFGNDQDVTLTHNADKGLILKHIATADDKPVSFTLQTGETDLAANDVIGKIEFQAPDEATGTDANLVAAEIRAISEGDFSSSANATALLLMTGASEAATEKMRITSAGRIGIGTATLDGNAQFQIEGTEEYFVMKHTSQMGIKLYGNDTNVLYSYDKDNDSLTGGIAFGHSDGSTFFYTNGSNERMRIASDGKISMGYGGTSASIFHFVRASGNVEIIHADATNASYAEDVLTFDCNRAATSSYNLVRGTSGGQADSEFIVDGAGRLAVDGTLNAGGADYAEFFEWKDGNSSNEDRVGHSVVLDGNKIVKATDSDDASKIIGVISVTPTVIGDSDIERWKLKHLTDDYGNYIYEDYTQTEWTIVEEGKDDIYHSYQTDLIPDGLSVPSDALVTTKDQDGNNLQRRKVNPDWNKDTTYIPRSERKEWDTVGLMGKLRLKKGQPTGTNWIKMRDISSTVEEWLVR
tara:strand:- start:2205 stop:4136 length:1932 start_codon:yes stop_codon:yes gene_type:complete